MLVEVWLDQSRLLSISEQKLLMLIRLETQPSQHTSKEFGLNQPTDGGNAKSLEEAVDQQRSPKEHDV